MTSNFIKIFIFLLLFSCTHAFAQLHEQEAQFKGGEIAFRKFLEKRFSQEDRNYKLPGCYISAIFAKFTIDSTGKVKNINFSSMDTTQVFRNILTAIIEATSGSWKPKIANGKAVESKPFILPLIYEMEAGCGPRGIAAQTSEKNNYKETPNALNVALIYLLNFDDDTGREINRLDCILLKPLRVFSQN